MAFKTYDRAMTYKRTHTKEFQEHLEVVSCGPVYRSSNLGGDSGWCRWTTLPTSFSIHVDAEEVLATISSLNPDCLVQIEQ